MTYLPRIQRLVLAVLAAHILTLAQLQPAQAQEPTTEAKVGAWVDNFAKRHKFNGAVAVLEKGKVVLVKAVGVARPAEGQMVAGNTLFNLAQASEPITAAAVLQLRDQGKLKLDDELAKYLPELNAYPGVTLYHLLTHTSGIPSYETLVAINKESVQQPNNREVVALFKRTPLPQAFRPGERVQYSSTDYALLATVVERVSGNDFFRYVKENVFDALGMKTSVIYNRLAYPTLPTQAQPLKMGFIAAPAAVAGAQQYVVGSDNAFVSIDDMAVWEQALNGGKFLGNETVNLMFEPARLNNGQANSGFGWVLSSNQNGRIATAEGASNGYRSLYRRYLGQKQAVIVLNNTGNGKVYDLVDGIYAILNGETPQEPRVSIAQTIGATLQKQGAGAAIQQYNSLKASARSEYDFRESELNVLGFELLGAGKTDEAIAIFKLNAETYPKSFNVYDSLAEAYAAAGNKEQAILNYRKSLALYPDNDVAREALRKLQGN